MKYEVSWTHSDGSRFVNQVYDAKDISELLADIENLGATDIVIKSITEHYYTAYSEEADITFIMKRTETETMVSGFYYGEPNEELTEQFKNKPIATM